MDVISLQLIGFVVSILLSGFFSASETALNSLNKLTIKRLLRKHGAGSRLMLFWTENPSKVLSAILIGNNLVNVAASVLASLIALHFAEQFGSGEAAALAIVTGVVTFILLVFGEISPKTYAQHNSETYIRIVALPLVFILIFLKPASWFLAKLALIFIFIVGGETKQKDHFLTITEEEIISLVEAGEIDGTIEEVEKEMIHSIIEFGDTIVREIMVPRVDIIASDISAGMEEVLDTMTGHKLSRIPVYEENMDDIVGIIHIKNVIAFWRKKVTDMPAIEFATPAYFVPETKRVADLLRELREKQIQMAIVVDEFGGTAGLVTLEDIIEEIVGEIEDEYDTKKQFIRKIFQGRYLVNTKIEIDQLNQRLDLELPDSEYNTLGGFISSLIKRLPKKNEIVNYKNVRFIIQDVDKKRINTVILIKR